MTSRIDTLVRRYERHISTPWQRTLAGAQRVIFVVYPKDMERVLRERIQDFRITTERARHEWRHLDCTSWFSDWMSEDEYQDAWFEDWELLSLKLEEDFPARAAERLRKDLQEADENEVVALTGVGSLYGFLRVSDLVRAIEPEIRGRLVVFFPGTKDGTNYRLLDARDGWNYLAQAITLHDEE